LVLALWPNFETPPLPFTMLQIVRCDGAVGEICEAASKELGRIGDIARIAGLDAPEQFAESLFQIYSDVSPASLLPNDLEEIVLNSRGHWLYWIGLEQIQHHVLLEMCDGVCRVYQARKRSAAVEANGFQEYQGVLLQACGEKNLSGYTAKEWVSSIDDRDEPLGVEKAHKKWGGGQDLARGEVSKILKLVASLQAQTQRITEKLREQAPRGFGITGEAGPEAIAHWAEKMLAQGRITMTPSRPGTPRTGVAGYADSGECWIFISGVKPEHDFHVPRDLAQTFMRDFALLTGEYPSASVFVGMLVFLGWEEAELEDGGRWGWTFRNINLRTRMQGPF